MLIHSHYFIPIVIETYIRCFCPEALAFLHELGRRFTSDEHSQSHLFQWLFIGLSSMQKSLNGFAIGVGQTTNIKNIKTVTEQVLVEKMLRLA